MKMNVAIAFAGSFLVTSMMLQGCVSSLGEEKKIEKELEETAASCMGGNFSCSGDWRSWCSKQEAKCRGTGSPPLTSCTPKCTWGCEEKKCDQTCAPKCAQALCSTRCKGFNTASCQMKCGEPDCKVVCPTHFCPGKDCAACKTECGKPVCKMQCKGDEQSCHHVCAQPRCAWECKKPKECPKPICSMKCEKPRDCLDNSKLVTNLPPLQPGETEVIAFHTSKDKKGGAPSPAAASMPPSVLAMGPAAASAVLLKTKSITTVATMKVEITTMGSDRKMQSSQVDLQMAPMFAIPTALPTWVKIVKREGGRVAEEEEASCDGGNFHCQGEAAWCNEQRDMVCTEAAAAQTAAESQQSEQVHSAPQDADEAAAEAEAAQGELQAAETVNVVGPADSDDEAEAAAAQALKDVGDVSAFVQKRSDRQGHLRA